MMLQNKFFIYTLGCICCPDIGVKLSPTFSAWQIISKDCTKKISFLAVKMNELRAFKNFLDQVKIMTPEQGWATSLVGGPDLVKKVFFAGQTKHKKFLGVFQKKNYFKIKEICVTANV